MTGTCPGRTGRPAAPPDPGTDPLALELRGALGRDHVLTDPDLRASYETDWTRRWSAKARLVARPANASQVAAVLGAAARSRVPVVAQGGNTGLVGGSVPRGGELLLSLGRLDQIGVVDEAAAQLQVGAGVTLARAREVANAAGLDVPVDLAARHQATIGGMVATNAGGVHAFRHGDMRANLCGVEVVLADGRVVRRMEGVTKDNTGYDLVGLVAGSEGTLGVVTAALLRLIPLWPFRVTALVGVAGSGHEEATAAALGLLSVLRRRLPSLEAVELMYPEGVGLVCAHGGLQHPLDSSFGACLLIECAGEDDPTPELAAAVGDQGDVVGTAVASESSGRRALWSYRELHTEAVSSLGVPHKLDVCLPLSRLASFAGAVGRVVDAAHPGARTVLFGHLGDGNLHVNVVGPAEDDESVDDAVLGLALDHGGSISAEHGIGVAKTRWLLRARGAAEVSAMRAVKAALDPANLLNPGVLLPAEV